MKKTLSFIFLLLLVAGAGVAFYGYKQVFGSYVTQNVSLKIPSESSYDELIKKLEEKNLIKNKQVFDLYIKCNIILKSVQLKFKFFSTYCHEFRTALF